MELSPNPNSSQQITSPAVYSWDANTSAFQASCFRFFDHITDSTYGIDEDGPVPTDDDESVVQIPDCSYTLNDSDFTLLQQTIDPLSSSEEYGIDLYEQTLQFLDHL